MMYSKLFHFVNNLLPMLEGVSYNNWLTSILHFLMLQPIQPVFYQYTLSYVSKCVCPHIESRQEIIAVVDSIFVFISFVSYSLFIIN